MASGKPPDLVVRIEGFPPPAAPSHSDDERAEKDREAELERFADFGRGVLDVSKGSLERARSAAELIQKSASAVAILYTGVLGLVFSVGEQPLPARGLLPVVFLGMAIALSTFFVAVLNDATAPKGLAPQSSPREATWQMLGYFFFWARGATDRHRSLLRGAALAVAAAVLLLPAPFITFKAATTEPVATRDWPAPLTKVQSPSLRAIAYRAQVEEVLQQNLNPSKPIADDDLGWVWWIITGGFAAIILGVALGPYLARNC